MYLIRFEFSEWFDFLVTPFACCGACLVIAYAHRCQLLFFPKTTWRFFDQLFIAALQNWSSETSLLGFCKTKQNWLSWNYFEGEVLVHISTIRHHTTVDTWNEHETVIEYIINCVKHNLHRILRPLGTRQQPLEHYMHCKCQHHLEIKTNIINISPTYS